MCLNGLANAAFGTNWEFWAILYFTYFEGLGHLAGTETETLVEYVYV